MNQYKVLFKSKLFNFSPFASQLDFGPFFAGVDLEEHLTTAQTITLGLTIFTGGLQALMSLIFWGKLWAPLKQGYLRVKVQQVSTEGPLKNGDNMWSAWLVWACSNFLRLPVRKQNTIKPWLSGLAQRNALSASRSLCFLSSAPPASPQSSFPHGD